MCVACVGAAAPEVAIVLGGYAVARFGRPVERLRARLSGPPPDEAASRDDTAAPSGEATATPGEAPELAATSATR